MDKAEWLDAHAINTGKLIGNLQQIEMAARLFLSRNDPAERARTRSQLPQLKEGDLVEENILTHPGGLGHALNRFNSFAKADCLVEVDRAVRLRDQLAHGRIFAFGEHTNATRLRLVKLSKDREPDGRIRVEIAADMNEEWFSSNLRFLMGTLDKIARALEYEIRELGPSKAGKYPPS